MSGMKKRLKMKRTRKALEETKEITAVWQRLVMNLNMTFEQKLEWVSHIL